MEQLTYVIKTVLDKHLLPSIISIAGAIVTLLLTPENNLALQKLDTSLFILLIFCLCFSFIQIITYITKQFVKLLKFLFTKKTTARHSDIQYKKNINTVYSFVDSLIPNEKKLLITFIENNNKILITSKASRNYPSLLDNTKIINSSNFTGDISNLDYGHYWIDPNLQQTFNQGMKPFGTLMQYKLQEDFFTYLKHIYVSTGKLGNF